VRRQRQTEVRLARRALDRIGKPRHDCMRDEAIRVGEQVRVQHVVPDRSLQRPLAVGRHHEIGHAGEGRRRDDGVATGRVERAGQPWREMVRHRRQVNAFLQSAR
jgi:hypothetical protein